MRNHTTFLTLVSLTACLIVAQAAKAQETYPYRIWTDSTGEHKVEAAFIKLEDGSVHLKRKDNGNLFSVPVRRMSPEDLTLVRKLVREAKPVAEASASLASGSLADSPDQTDGANKKAWTGNWNNRKYGTDGPVTCIATVADEKTWKASFVGKGLGKPFKYDVTITATPKGNQIQLEGTSKIDGDAYQWNGYVKDNVLYGRYRSGSGNNGEFQLKETPVPATDSQDETPGQRRPR